MLLLHPFLASCSDKRGTDDKLSNHSAAIHRPLIKENEPKPMARERPSKQSSVVKLCQYLGAHLDGHRYEAGICPILPRPLTIAIAAARLTGGRGTLVLTHPMRMIPPMKTLSVRYNLGCKVSRTHRYSPCTCQTRRYIFQQWSWL